MLRNLLGLVVLLCASLPAQAETIRIDFSGEVWGMTTFGNPAIPHGWFLSTIGFGTPISASLVYSYGGDPDTAFLISADVTLDGHELPLTLGTENSMAVENDTVGPLQTYDLATWTAADVSGPLIYEFLTPSRLELSVFDSDHDVFTDTTPTVEQLLALEDEPHRLRLVFDDFNGVLSGAVTTAGISDVTISVSEVPLPAGAVMMLSGIALLGLRKRLA